MLHYVCNFAHCGGLRYFVARQFLPQIYALFSVKFSDLKICECKNNDKYQVWCLRCLFQASKYLNILQTHIDIVGLADQWHSTVQGRDRNCV